MLSDRAIRYEPDDAIMLVLVKFASALPGDWPVTVPFSIH